MHSLKPFFLKYWKALLTAGFAVAMVYLSGDVRENGRYTFFPTLSGLPVFFAPILTAVFTFHLSLDYLQKENCRILHGLTMILMVCTTLLCIKLTIGHEWNFHLQLMILLFVLYTIWDVAALQFTNMSAAEKQEVRNGHLFVNLPTLSALILVYVFLWSIIGNNLEITKFLGKYEVPTGAENDLVVTSYTHGIVTFHMIASSVSYFVISGRAGWSKKYIDWLKIS